MNVPEMQGNVGALFTTSMKCRAHSADTNPKLLPPGAATVMFCLPMSL